MVVNWGYLIIALIFGLLPPLRLLNSDCRFLSFEDLWERVAKRKDGGQKRRRWWKLPLVWIDPFRGYVVGDMISRAFRAPPKSNFFQAQLPLLALLAAVVIVMVVQTKGRRHERESLSPAGFLAGLMLGLMQPVIAIGSLVVGAATMVALQRYSFGYWAAAIMTALLGAAFMGPTNFKVGVFFLIVSSPAWISWLRGTTLVTPVRC